MNGFVMFYEGNMCIYKSKHNIVKKVIAMAVVCLFIINGVVLTNSASSMNINRTTLAVQSSFQALINEEIEVSLQTQFEILAGVRLLLAGKNYSAVNGILLETYGGGIEQGKSNIEYLPGVERDKDGKKVKATFIVKGKEDVVFEIEYVDTKTEEAEGRERKAEDDISVEDAELQKPLSLVQLTWENVFQKNDVIKINRIPKKKKQKSLQSQQNIEAYPEVLDLWGSYKKLGKILSVKELPARRLSRSIYLVETTMGQYVVKSVSMDEKNMILRSVEITKHLKKKKFPYYSPTVQLNDTGHQYVGQENRIFYVTDFLAEGKDKTSGSRFNMYANLTDEEIKSCGRMLAAFHKCMEDFKVSAMKPRPSDFEKFSEMIQNIKNKMDKMENKDDRGSTKFFNTNARYVLEKAENFLRTNKNIIHGLPKMHIHGDFQQMNILFNENQAVGLLDFDTIKKDTKMNDFSAGIVEGEDYDLEVAERNLKLFIDSYSEENMITVEEKKMVQFLLKFDVLKRLAGALTKGYVADMMDHIDAFYELTQIRMQRLKRLEGDGGEHFKAVELSSKDKVESVKPLAVQMAKEDGPTHKSPLFMLQDPIAREFVRASLVFSYGQYGVDRSIPETIVSLLADNWDNPEKASEKVYEFMGQPESEEYLLAEIYKKRYKIEGKPKVYMELLGKHLPEGTTVVDIGCGNNFLAECIAENKKNVEAIGVDIIPYGQRVPTSVKAEFRQQMPGKKIPIDDGTVDVVILSSMIHHIDLNSIKPFLDDVRRILKDDGKILVIEDAYSETIKPTYNPDELTEKFLAIDPKNRNKALQVIDWTGGVLIPGDIGMYHPYHLKSIEEWEKTFNENSYSVKEKEFIGFKGFFHLNPQSLLILEKSEKNFSDSIDKDMKDEMPMLMQAKRHLKGSPVNMHIDLTTVPKEEDQLEENMDTLAQLIAWHNMFGLNVRYVLENDIDGKVLELLKSKLNTELGPLVGAPYSLGETIETQNGERIEVKEDNLIDIRLENFEGINKDRRIKGREYLVALKDDSSKAGTAIPNYTAAAAMGLSLAALRVARDKLEKQPEEQVAYEQFRGKILDRVRSIYKRYSVITNENNFSEDELELMVMGSSATKLYYTMLYALPPVIKIIEEIHKYHEMMRDVLISA